MKRILQYTILAYMILFGGCKDNTQSPSQNQLISTNPIFPLAIGNSWTFRTIDLDTNGNITYTGNPLTKTIQKDTLIQNKRWFNYRDDLLSSESDGIYFYNKYKPDKRYLCYKYPASVNETYDFGYMRIIVISTNENITVPKGTFGAYQFRFINVDGSFWKDDFLVPNIGPVLSNYFDLNKRVSWKEELIEYSIK